MSARRLLAFLLLTAAVAAAAFAVAPTSGAAPASSADAGEVLLEPGGDRVYHAANPDFGGGESGVSGERIRGFEKLAGRRIAWAYFSNNWFGGVNFPARDIDAIYRSGHVPFVRLMARSSFRDYAPDRRYSMQSIVDGDWDGPRPGSQGLRSWCRQAAALGRPLLAEFGTEVNGAWFPWNGRWNGGRRRDGYGDPDLADGPERFRDAYRHIVSLCRAEGADNITWFFHVDADGQPAARWNRAAAYYPGADYVDWIGVSFYGSLLSRYDTEQLRAGLGRSLPALRRLAADGDKPIALLEFGTREERSRPGRKARWIARAGRDLRRRFPEIDAVSWWNEDYREAGEGVRLRIDSSPSALRAYRRTFDSRRYGQAPRFGTR